MPRNDQVTRQWHILQRLESSRRGLTLGDLLEALPPEYPRGVTSDVHHAC
jgi:hypothetical protein